MILHEKNLWNSAGNCFSLALLPLCSTQNGSFESERPKNLFWDVLFVHPPWLAPSTVQDISLSRFLPAWIMSFLLNCQLTGAGLSTSALEVHHLVLLEGKTRGLYCNTICHITASYLSNHSLTAVKEQG